MSSGLQAATLQIKAALRLQSAVMALLHPVSGNAPALRWGRVKEGLSVSDHEHETRVGSTPAHLEVLRVHVLE